MILKIKKQLGPSIDRFQPLKLTSEKENDMLDGKIEKMVLRASQPHGRGAVKNTLSPSCLNGTNLAGVRFIMRWI